MTKEQLLNLNEELIRQYNATDDPAELERLEEKIAETEKAYFAVNPVTTEEKPFADAQLISAAPELLAKSQRLIEIMEIQEKRHNGEFHLSADAFYPMWEEAKNEAKNAIAKATGTK